MKPRGNPEGAKCLAARPDTRSGVSADMPNIVLIDGDDLMRALLKEWLSDAGYTVYDGAPSAPPHADKADLVIVDLYMPRQTGAGCVRRIRHIYPDTPVIAMSAQFRPGLDTSARAAQALGAERLVPKPCTRGDLIDAVRAALGSLR